MTTRIPTANTTITIARDGKPPLVVRTAKRSEMNRIHQAQPIGVTEQGGNVSTNVGDALMFQELVVRWGIVDWGGDRNSSAHPKLGDIAPIEVYDDLTDDEIRQVSNIVQGLELTPEQQGN